MIEDIRGKREISSYWKWIYEKCTFTSTAFNHFLREIFTFR